MQFQFPLLPEHVLGVIYCVVGVVAAVTLTCKSSNDPNLDKIPTVGSNTWLGSRWAGLKFLINATAVVQEGYNNYKGTPFKVSKFCNWMVVFNCRQHVEEFRRFRDDELSFLEAASDVIISFLPHDQPDHFTGSAHPGADTHYNPYHLAILRSGLNRHLGALYGDIKDEIIMVFDDLLNLEEHEWQSVPALSTVQQRISRVSGRAFVGLPLCRNPDWVYLNIQFTLDVIKAAAIISFFPKFMASFVVRFVTNIHESTRHGIKHLSPIVEAQRKDLEEYGVLRGDGPNDLVTWLMDGSDSSERNVSNITSRILAVSFAAIHTSSTSFTHALYNLAANPEYIQPLREEAESIIKEEGWSKVAIEKMHKIDSFMKETQGMDGIGLVNMVRKAVKDVTFSDGTIIPKGTFVVMATQLIHSDNELYEAADMFDPFRFAKMRTDDGTGVKHQFSTTNPEYLVFGHGRHACPGRFFAATMLNTMLAHLVVSYDVKLEDNATRPPNLHVGTLIRVNPTTRIMLRKRIS